MTARTWRDQGAPGVAFMGWGHHPPGGWRCQSGRDSGRSGAPFGRIIRQPMIPTSRYTRTLALLLLLDAALLIPVLGRSTLSRIDETQIAEVSREMATGHDWVTPRIGTLPFAAYPPFQYWILASTGSVLGFNEF